MLSRQQTRHGLRSLAQQQISEVSKLPRKVRRALAKRIMKETIRRLNGGQKRDSGFESNETH